MKKILPIISLLSICSLIQAQGLYYFAATTGYGILYNPNKDVAKDRVGQGWTLGISFGCLFKKNMGFDLGVGFLDGTMSNHWSGIDASHSIVGTSTNTIRSFYLNPSLLFRGNGKIVLYGKSGTFLGINEDS
jgi:hypothetical protein